MKLINTCLTIALTNTICIAGGVHNTDFIPTLQDNKIVVGSVDFDTNEILYPSQVKSAVFGAEGFPNFTNDPGFNSELGALVPGMTVGFNVLQALRVWDEVTGDFDTIAEEQLTVRGAGQNILTPLMDTVVPGVIFGQASLDPSASFHHHLQYLLEGGQPPMIDGVWLLAFELWTENSSIESSDPVYIVFGQGAGLVQIDDAVVWVEDNLIASPCLADVNDDGELDFVDISVFLAAYANMEAEADFNSDGEFDFSDISVFITSYTDGCP